MSKTVAILGRQPALGLAELESLFGADSVQPVGNAAVVGMEPADFPMQRLGGTMKAAKLLTTMPFTEWNTIEAFLKKAMPEQVPTFPEGKIKLGLSVYGLKVNVKRLNATGLELKKTIKSTGRSVRVVPNKELDLNSAQVSHNSLTGPTGMELLLIRDGDQTVLAQTFAVQDIEAYAARDQARPKRDARVGMLPPKLAQQIVNLAVGQKDSDEEFTVLDPFCGTGVVLQEALLMGYKAYGTDLEPRMIEYANTNLDWLTGNYRLPTTNYRTGSGDATEYKWEQPFDTIAGETYLGQPFSAEPKPEKLKQVMQDVGTIHKKFLKNVAKQTQPGFRMCIAVPAWKTKSGFKHLKTLENLDDLGYTRLSFAHARDDELIYHREGQVVARELVVLIRK